MATKRRRGRPRKTGNRYRSGNLRPKHEPTVSPAAIAATQPHRKGLGERVADQLAESELGRMVIRGQITQLQHLAGQRYAAQWRAYLATLDGPRSPQRGQGRGNPCGGCDGPERTENCACDRAKRSWERSVSFLSTAEILVTARVCVWDWPARPDDLVVLRCGLTMLADVLGLTTRNKSARVENLNSNYVRND